MRRKKRKKPVPEARWACRVDFTIDTRWAKRLVHGVPESDRPLSVGSTKDEVMRRLGPPVPGGGCTKPVEPGIRRPELVVPVHKSNDLVTFEHPTKVGAGRKVV